MFAQRHLLADRLRSFCAAASVALVLALTVFAASPTAHHWLHVDDATQAGHDCAVVLFANGVSLPVGPVHVCPPVEIAHELSSPTAAEVFLVSPRFLRQPERGPPAERVS